jgi:sterol desaturase/sphingolipid hydroxylase (fatty acid hydroxylase superfamily)
MTHHVSRQWHHVAIQLAISAAYLFGMPAILKAFWPDLLKIFGGERGLFGLGTTALHLCQVVLGNLGLLFLYWNCFPAVEKFKINKHKPWPWRSPDEEERKRFWSTVRWGVATVLFNNFFIAIPASFGTYDLMQPFGGFSSSLEDWPSTFTLIWQIAFCAVCEDFAFYWGHRFLHWVSTSRRLH